MGRLKGRPGFVASLSGFEITENEIGRDGWTEGFITWDEAMSDE